MNNKIKLFGKDLSDVIYSVVKAVVLTVFVIICVYPFYYVIIYSLSEAGRAAKEGVYLWPRGFTLANYRDVLSLGGLYQAFLVSVARTVLGTLISLICTTMLAYLMTKDMWAKKFAYRYFIITMYISGGLIPWYLVMSTYGLTNNFLAYIIPTALSAYNMILIKTFIEQIPASMEESASIEGAGLMTTFFKIIIPLSKPIIATISVYCMVSQWNSWQDNFFLNRKKELMTMQLVLRNYLNQAKELLALIEQGTMEVENLDEMLTPEAVRMTSVVVTMVPVMLVYPFAQKYFTKGIMMGAVKG